jgi:predicted nucleic acid-binding Zn finger protein
VCIYTDTSGEASAWEFRLGPLRFTLVLSPETWRGFSGEGQLLETLARREDNALFHQARASLKWQASLPIEEFAENWDVPVQTVRETLQRLAAQGLVGYDLEAGAYFHRELPFTLDKSERLNPRLKNARKLVSTEGVQIVSQKKDDVEAYVRGSGVEHRVRQVQGTWRCTCPWYAKHQGQRGPCKHILAVQMSTEEAET